MDGSPLELSFEVFLVSLGLRFNSLASSLMNSLKKYGLQFLHSW